ncbi:MAG: hypothetical protein AAFZ18_07555 [Myxococcota bacterium]
MMTKLEGAALALLMIAAPGVTQAAETGIELKDFQAFRAVDGMGKQLIESRDAVDDVLFTMTAAQRAVRRANKEKEEAVARHGLDSHDAALADGRLRAVKREQISKTLQELQILVPRIKAAKQTNRRQLRKLLGSSRNFRELVKGQIKSKRNPAVLATLVYLATARLSARADELYANVLLGKIDIDIKDVTRTLDLVSKLIDPSATTATIGEAWAELSPAGDALSPTLDEDLDDLDRLIGQKD